MKHIKNINFRERFNHDIYLLFIFAFIILLLSNIQIQQLPTSPITIATSIGFFYLLTFKKIKIKHIEIIDKRLFFIFLILSVYLLSYGFLLGKKLPPFVISLSILLFAYIAFISGKSQKKFDFLAHIYFSVLFLSLLIFLLTSYSPTLASIMSRYTELEGEFGRIAPRGLSRAAFLLGYQLTALSIFALCKYFAAVTQKRRLIFATMFLIAIAGLGIQGTRSGFFGFVLAVMIMLYHYRHHFKKLLFSLIFLGVLSFMMILITSGQAPTLSEDNFFGARGTVQDRMMDSKDHNTRFGMQLFALKIIIQYPFGLGVEGKDWKQLLFSETRMYNNLDDVQAVHNAYLGIMLENGMIPGILLLVMTAYTIIISMQMIRYFGSKRTMDWRIAIPLCFISDQVSALFHNACYINEPFSAGLFFLLLAQHSLIAGNTIRKSIGIKAQETA